MIVLCEPQHPVGFQSGGYRYQAEVMAARLAARDGERRVLAPEQLAATVAELRQRPGTVVVVDGLFAQHRPLPAGAIALLHMVPALFLHAYDAAEIRDDPVARKAIEDGAMGMREFLQRMPYKRGHTPLAAVPNLEAVLMRYQNFDGLDAWWREEVLDQASKLDRYADLPTVFSTGWYDCFVAEVTWQFAEMTKRSRSPQRLIVGPWNHGGMRGGASRVGEVEFGKDAA